MTKKKYSFSIIIPTRNRSRVLEGLLSTVLKLTYPRELFEMIVVDNGSSDGTRDVIHAFIKANPGINCLYIFESRVGPSFARNAGIKKATSTNVVCIDDDVRIDKNLLKKYKQVLENQPDAVIIGGKCVVVSDNNQRMEKYLNLLGGDAWVFSLTSRKEQETTTLRFPDDLPSANIYINSNLVKGKVFNEDFGKVYGKLLIFSEDNELCLRLLSKGKKVIYDPSIISEHYILSEKISFKYIINRFFRSGIEHRLLDQRFNKIGYRCYKFNIRNLLQLLWKYLVKPKISNLIPVIREILYLIGYYFPVSLLAD